MLPRRETRWNLQGWPKVTKWSQPLVGRSSPYCGYMWRRYWCLTSFFPIVNTCLSCKDIARKSAMVPRWRLFGDFLGLVFSANRVQQVSDLHSKFALRPHHVWKCGRHPICDGWDYARKKRRKRNRTKIYICPHPAMQGSHKKGPLNGSSNQYAVIHNCTVTLTHNPWIYGKIARGFLYQISGQKANLS